MNYMFYAHSCTAGNSCASPAVPIRMRKTKVAYLSIRKIAWVLEYLPSLFVCKLAAAVTAIAYA